ncbi:TDRD1_4_6_7 [Mytilus edulis]|uniref:TDRD1_4_6_7 n=1 Tax=Mytilus edulis TaxID=6550 RepID=A0A8S3T6K1_MYTED|nr:TDRD1_4_6_7 [Mytilus edulis]
MHTYYQYEPVQGLWDPQKWIGSVHDGPGAVPECKITSSIEYKHESDSADYNDNSRNGMNMVQIHKDQEPDIQQESNIDNNEQLAAVISDLPIYLGKVTYIIDLDYFYMHIGTAEQLEEFCVLEDSIASYCETSSCIENVSYLWLEQMVLVDCQENNGCWRRGQVTRIDSENNSADVFYIDYGETENVKDNRICIELLEEFLSFPSQALRCCLAGIRPIAKKWIPRAVRIFEQHTSIKIFNTVILTTEHGIFKVALYSRDGKHRCLSNILVDEDLGIPVEDEVTEYFEDAEEFYAARFTQSATDNYADYNAQYNMVNGQVYSEGNISEAYQEVGDQPESIPYVDNDSSLSEISPRDVDRGDNSSSSLLEKIIQRKDASSPFASLLANISDRNSSSPTSSRKDNSSSSSRVDTSSLSNSLLLNVNTAAESALTNSTGQSLSPQMIPQFNLDSLQKTHHTTTDKLLEKKHKEIQKESKIEQERVKKETVEQSKLAILAGYGGLEDDTSKHSKPTKTPQTPRDKWTSSELAPKSPEDWDRELRLLQTNKADLALKELPPPPIEKRDTPHGRELLKILNQIFVDSEREPVDEIRVRLLSLFQTDAYLFLNKEELGELMNTVINRAVRYYGVIHDIILEILDVLSSTIPLQEYVASLLEKWIMFNKKGKQIGTDKLQEIYLECFEMIWEILRESLLDRERQISSSEGMPGENTQYSSFTVMHIRSRTLQIYLLLNMKQKKQMTTDKDVQAGVMTSDVGCQTEDIPFIPEEKTEFTVAVKYQKSTRPPFFPPKSSKYYRPNSRSSTPSSVHSDKSEDSWPNLSKSSASGVRKVISPVADGKPSSNDNSFRSDVQSPAGDDVLLMTPASFTDSLHSPDDSSVYYSVSDNFNNSSELNFKDTSSSENLLKPTPHKSDDHENRNIHLNDRLHKSPREHPVIESSPKSSKVHASPKSSTVNASQKTDWWDMDEDIKMAQTRVKDNWYDTEDSSENISIKSEIVPAKSLADCANALLVPAKTHRSSQPSLPQVKTNVVVNEKTCMKSSLRQEQVKTTKSQCLSHVSYADKVKPICGEKYSTTQDTIPVDINMHEDSSLSKDTSGKQEEPTDSGKNKVIDWWKIGVDEDNDTDKDLDNFDDEDWESYSGSTEDISQSLTSESVSSEVPEKTASKSSKVTIVRDYQTAEKPKPSWTPGARTCTMCGDTSHLIYDCPNKT